MMTDDKIRDSRKKSLKILEKDELIENIFYLEEEIECREAEIACLKHDLGEKEKSLKETLTPLEPLRVAERLIYGKAEMVDISGDISVPRRYTTQELKQIAENLLVYINNRGE